MDEQLSLSMWNNSTLFTKRFTVIASILIIGTICFFLSFSVVEKESYVAITPPWVGKEKELFDYSVWAKMEMGNYSNKLEATKKDLESCRNEVLHRYSQLENCTQELEKAESKGEVFQHSPSLMSNFFGM